MTTVTNPLDRIEAHAGASDKDREAWLAERRSGVTATQIRDLYTGAKQMQDLIDLKLGRREDTFTGNAYTRWGTEREPVIAEKLAGEGFAPESRVFHHPEHHRHLASPDGVRVTFDGDLEVLEIKTASTDLPPGSPELEKKGYVPQIQWNLWVLEASRGRLVVEERLMGPEGFEAGRVFRHWIERDDAIIGQLVQIADEFLAELDRQRDEGRPVIDEDVDTHALNYLRGLAAEKEGKALKESAYRALIEAGVSQESPLARVTFTPSKEKPPVEVVVVDEESAKQSAAQVWAKVQGARKRAELAEAQWAEVLAAHTTVTTEPGGFTAPRVTVTAGKGTKA